MGPGRWASGGCCAAEQAEEVVEESGAGRGARAVGGGGSALFAAWPRVASLRVVEGPSLMGLEAAAKGR